MHFGKTTGTGDMLKLVLILGALATVALVKWPPFYRLMGAQKVLLGYALAFACWWALW